MGRPEVGAIALLGQVFTVFVLVALFAAFAVPLHRHWARIAVRVVGSLDRRVGLADAGLGVTPRLNSLAGPEQLSRTRQTSKSSRFGVKSPPPVL